MKRTYNYMKKKEDAKMEHPNERSALQLGTVPYKITRVHALSKKKSCVMQKYGALQGIETCHPTLGHGALATKRAQRLFLYP
jgi:hypothetical protein